MNELRESTPIRLILLHELALFRESLARLLASEPDFEVIAECATAAEALEAVRGRGADIFLLDLKTSDDSANDFIEAARNAGYGGKFLIVASRLDADSCADALRLGASGIFLESGSSARFTQAIRLVASGEAFIDQKIIQLLADRYPHFSPRKLPARGLTERQQTVLQCVANGLSNRKIGDRLGVSEGTIKATLQQLFMKAGVRTRSQLLRLALDGSFGVVADEAPDESTAKNGLAAALPAD